MASNADFVVRAVINYLAQETDGSLELRHELDWPERYVRLDQGDLDVAWICGAPYVQRQRRGAGLELLAAPVWRGDRYGGEAIYFSDVVVHRDSPLQTFEELRGSAWAYNEPNSLSGYAVMLARLAEARETAAFFGRRVNAGSHSEALNMVLAGQVDCAAIDTTVLDLRQRQQPDVANRLRIVETLGPNPMPPWVVGTHVAPADRAALRRTLLQMHETVGGQAVLAELPISRFAPMQDRDYDPVRQVLRVVERMQAG